MITNEYSELLKRVNYREEFSDIENFIKSTASEYKLGKILKHEPITEGYEDLNIKVTTNKGKYVIKIFGKDNNDNNNRDYIKAVTRFYEKNIPVPKLVKPELRDWMCIMEFFEGKNFVNTKPSEEDLRKIISWMAQMHSIDFKVHRTYNTWGAAYLLPEFEKKKDCVRPEELKLIQPIVDEFRKIDFESEKFRKCVIHGDLNRKHVLKNGNRYCIIDFGCMDFNARVFDIGIFLAFFAFDQNSNENDREMFQFVIDEYQKTSKLSNEELQSIPVIIKAAYSMFVLSPSHMIATGIDTRKQTYDWLETGRRKLEMHNNLEMTDKIKNMYANLGDNNTPPLLFTMNNTPLTEYIMPRSADLQDRGIEPSFDKFL